MAKAVKTPKTNAMRELESAGISYVLHTYEDDGDESVGLGVAISEQLGEEPGQGFKTLVCVTPSNDYVVCCIPVADELDLKSAARAAGEKSLAMMHVKDLLAATGYVRGGCSPVGMKKRYRTLIDETCVLWDTIFISGGKSFSGVSATTAGQLSISNNSVNASFCLQSTPATASACFSENVFLSSFFSTMSAGRAKFEGSVVYALSKKLFAIRAEAFPVISEPRGSELSAPSQNK